MEYPLMYGEIDGNYLREITYPYLLKNQHSALARLYVSTCSFSESGFVFVLIFSIGFFTLYEEIRGRELVSQ